MHASIPALLHPAGRTTPPGRSRSAALLAAVLGLVATMIVVATPATAQGETIVVNTPHDDNILLGGECPGTDTFATCSLRQAVEDAVDGDTIVFADGIDPVLTPHRTSSASFGQIVVEEKRITIIGNVAGDDGPGTTISGNDALEGGYNSRLFRIGDMASITFENVTLTGGNPQVHTTDDGGAILSTGELNIHNSRLHGNVADRGGAIQNEDGTVTITQSRIDSNEAGLGGGLHNVDGEVNIADSLLGGEGQGNTASSSGGALLNLSGNEGEATMTITRSALISNSSPGWGGAVTNDSADQQGQDHVSVSTLTIVDSTFSDNVSPIGGAVFNILDGSSASIAGSTFVGNEGTTQGGALFNARGDIAVVNSTFSGNHAAQAGGAIFNNGADESLLTLTHVTIFGNSAEEGGGLYQEGTFGDVPGGGHATLAHSIIAENVGGDCDGQVSDATGDVRITSAGHNLDSDGTCAQEDNDVTAADARLGDLAANGGATLTHLPLEGSPAIEGGLNPTCLVDSDQRGEPRPGANSDACDIGAVEVQVIVDEVDEEEEEADDDDDEEDVEEAVPAEPVEEEPDFTG